MQYSIALIFGAAAMVAAQTPDLSAIPQCGQTCINNMIQLATTSFGCAATNITCFCTEPRFGFGLNDCALEACGAAVQQQVLAFGSAYCQSVGAGTGANGAVSALSSGASAASGSATIASGLISSASAAGSNAASAVSGLLSSTPYTTQAVVTTITSGGSTQTSTIGSTTLFSAVAGGASMSASSILSNANSRASSLVSGASSLASSILGSASSRASSVTAVSTSTSAAGAAVMTAAPMFGAAALAALFL